jgi:hypothetical protein
MISLPFADTNVFVELLSQFVQGVSFTYKYYKKISPRDKSRGLVVYLVDMRETRLSLKQCFALFEIITGIV